MYLAAIADAQPQAPTTQVCCRPSIHCIPDVTFAYIVFQFAGSLGADNPDRILLLLLLPSMMKMLV